MSQSIGLATGANLKCPHSKLYILYITPGHGFVCTYWKASSGISFIACTSLVRSSESEVHVNTFLWYMSTIADVVDNRVYRLWRNFNNCFI